MQVGQCLHIFLADTVFRVNSAKKVNETHECCSSDLCISYWRKADLTRLQVIRWRLLGMQHLALRGIIYNPYFGWAKVTTYKMYRTVDSSSLTPAWSPSEDQRLATSSHIASNPPDRPQYPLLDERLAGALLKVSSMMATPTRTAWGRSPFRLPSLEGWSVYNIMSIMPQKAWPCMGDAKNSQCDSRQWYPDGS